MKQHLKADSLRLFYRSLATLLVASVRIDRALELLGRQGDDEHMAHVCRAMSATVSRGQSLSAAMAKWPDEFSELEVRLVQVGEVTGNIDHLLDRLASYEEGRRRVTMRVKGALTYPLFIFAVTVSALVVIPPYLFGGLFKLIESLGVEVPLLTRMVLVFAKVVSSPYFALAVALGALVAVKVLPELYARRSVKLKLARWGLRLPVIGPSLRTIAITRFSRALEIMLNCGVSIDQCIRLSFVASGNPALDERTDLAIERITSGATLREALEETEFFRGGFLQVVSVGEETGRLPSLLSRVADMYEVQLTYTLESLVAALEPLMMLVMGFLVGIFIIASMQPMSQILQKL